jgi:ATP-dependent helicase/nuclease subunit B
MIEKRAVAAIGYVHLTGGEPAGEDRPLDVDVMELAERHLAGLTRLLGAYANADQAYLPRAMMEREEDESDYDHLSRFREWTLAGDLS